MNMLLGITITAGVLLTAAQAYVSNSSRRTEQRPYTVLESEGDIEIRWYPPVNMAAYESANSLHENQGGSFRVLAGYIFGGNDKGKQIAMTAPVEMRNNNSGSEMRFMMPTSIPLDSLPVPRDTRIRLFTEEGFHAATLTYGGYSSESKALKHAEKLRNYLEKAGLACEGDLIVLGYNPPYQVVDRKNEVMFHLKNYPVSQP